MKLAESLVAAVALATVITASLPSFKRGANARQARANEAKVVAASAALQSDRDTSTEQLARQARLVSRVRQHGASTVVVGASLMPEYLVPLTQLRSQLTSAEHTESVAAQRLMTAEQHAAHGPLAMSTSMATTLGLVWILLTTTMWILDKQLVESIGLRGLQGVAIASATTAMVEGLGLFFYAAVGLHEIEAIASLRAEIRILLAGISITVLLSIILFGLVPLSRSRADSVQGKAVLVARAQQGQLEETNSTPAQVKTGLLRISKLQAEYDKAARVNAVLGGLPAGFVFFISFAPGVAVAHGRVSAAKRSKKRASLEVFRAAANIDDFDAKFTADRAVEFDRAGLEPADLAIRDIASPPAGPVNPPPAGPVNPPPLDPPGLPDPFDLYPLTN